MLNNYFVIFILRKNNNIFFVYLVSNFEILRAKIAKNNIALF